MRTDNGAEALASMRIARTMRNDIAQAICPHLLRSLRFGAAPRARSASCVGGSAAAARLPRLRSVIASAGRSAAVRPSAAAPRCTSLRRER